MTMFRVRASAALAAAASLSAAVEDASAAGTDLGGGIITVSDVQDRALISLDLADMYSLLSSSSPNYNEASNIYVAGKNSPQYDRAGKELPNKRTLAGLSTAAAGGKFDGEPAFVTHVFGLSGLTCDLPQDDQRDAYGLYADRTVRDMLENQRGTMAAEAARALNLWMYATHELYDGVEDCARLASGINAEAAGLADNGKGAYAFDEFIAFWLGSGQVPGSEQGHSLYAMAQQAGALFGTLDSSNKEARANTNIKNLYNEAQEALAIGNACKSGSDTASRLWGITHRIIAQMSVPLLQMLVHSMKEDDADRVKLYARSVVPQMARCRQSTYLRLKEELLDRPWDGSKFGRVLADLQDSYDCLGVSCEDVGAYKVDAVAQCAGFPVNYPIAEYSPTSDVRSLSKFDLDITELKILLCYDSDRSREMALNLYNYGQNTLKFRSKPSDPYSYLSLREMATSPMKEKAPWSTHFTEYHQSKHHADKVIVDTLNGAGKWGNASPQQRAETVAKTAQYQVVFQYLLGEMADATEDCLANDATLGNDGTAHSWDEVVALYIGSQEGTGEGGSDDFGDGQFMWNLGNKRCTQFGTENSGGWSVVMAAVEDLFYAGKGELDAYDCANLQRTVHKIEHLSLIPLVQSVMRYAIRNEKHAWNSATKDLAEGEAFALSVLPILAAYDPIGQSIVEENMIVAEGKEPVMDGAQAVADAFDGVLRNFGLECQYVGESDGVDACNLSARSGGDNRVVGTMVAAILAAGASFALTFWG